MGVDALPPRQHSPTRAGGKGVTARCGSACASGGAKLASCRPDGQWAVSIRSLPRSSLPRGRSAIAAVDGGAGQHRGDALN